jgi:hypothetical protein
MFSFNLPSMDSRLRVEHERRNWNTIMNEEKAEMSDDPPIAVEKPVVKVTHCTLEEKYSFKFYSPDRFTVMSDLWPFFNFNDKSKYAFLSLTVMLGYDGNVEVDKPPEDAILFPIRHIKEYKVIFRNSSFHRTRLPVNLWVRLTPEGRNFFMDSCRVLNYSFTKGDITSLTSRIFPRGSENIYTLNEFLCDDDWIGISHINLNDPDVTKFVSDNPADVGCLNLGQWIYLLFYSRFIVAMYDMKLVIDLDIRVLILFISKLKTLTEGEDIKSLLVELKDWITGNNCDDCYFRSLLRDDGSEQVLFPYDWNHCDSFSSMFKVQSETIPKIEFTDSCEPNYNVMSISSSHCIVLKGFGVHSRLEVPRLRNLVVLHKNDQLHKFGSLTLSSRDWYVLTQVLELHVMHFKFLKYRNSNVGRKIWMELNRVDAEVTFNDISVMLSSLYCQSVSNPENCYFYQGLMVLLFTGAVLNSAWKCFEEFYVEGMGLHKAIAFAYKRVTYSSSEKAFIRWVSDNRDVSSIMNDLNSSRFVNNDFFNVCNDFQLYYWRSNKGVYDPLADPPLVKGREGKFNYRFIPSPQNVGDGEDKFRKKQKNKKVKTCSFKVVNRKR